MISCRQVLLASEILVCLGIVLSFHVVIPYSVPQYVCSALITFVAAEVLEGKFAIDSTNDFKCSNITNQVQNMQVLTLTFYLESCLQGFLKGRIMVDYFQQKLEL